MIILLFIFLSVSLSETLYGFSPSIVQLNEIEFSKDKIVETKIGKPVDELIAQQLSSLDPLNKILYAITFNTTDQHAYLTGVGIEKGTVEHHIVLPFKDIAFVGVGQFIQVDPKSGDVFVVGEEGDKIHHIVRVTPKSGDMKEIAQIADIDLIGACSGYNVDSKVLYLQYYVADTKTIDIFGWDVDSGKMVCQIENTNNMQTMEYDPVSKKIWGLGLNIVEGSKFERTLVTLDADHKLETVGKIDTDLVIIEAGVSALDSVGRSIFGLLNKDNATSADPFSLVSISMKDLTIQTSAKCLDGKTYPVCPWSLEHMRKF